MYLVPRERETSRENRRETQLFGRFESSPVFLSRGKICGALPYQKYVKWMYPFNSAMCEIIQAEEIAHRISSINKSHDKLANLLYIYIEFLRFIKSFLKSLERDRYNFPI